MTNKKAISVEARQLLKDGKSRQETFEILNEKYNSAFEIADILRYLPSKKAIEKYRKWNVVLLGLLILTAAAFLLPGPTFGIILWYGLLIYAVARMLVKYYVFVTILSAIAIISFIVILSLNDGSTEKQFVFIILGSLLIPTLILPVWLENKLCPKPLEKKESYTNIEGKKRLKVVFEFPEES